MTARHGDGDHGLAAVLAALSEEKIARVPDDKTKSALADARRLLVGVHEAFASGASDGDTVHVRQGLTEVSLGPAQVKAIGDRAVSLLAAVEVREQKSAEYHTAVTHADEIRVAIEHDVGKAGSKLRGQFGSTSDKLGQFGVARVGGAHHGGGHHAAASSGSGSSSGSSGSEGAGH